MSDNTKKAGPKQYSNKSRKPQSLISKIAKHGDTAVNVMSGMIIGGGAYGLNLALTARSKAEKAAKERFNKFVADLDKKRVKESLEKRASKYSKSNVKIPKVGGQFNKPFAAKTGPRRKIKNRLFDI